MSLTPSLDFISLFCSCDKNLTNEMTMPMFSINSSTCADVLACEFY